MTESPWHSTTLFALGPVPVSVAVATSWAIMAGLILAGWLSVRHARRRPGHWQAAMEIVVTTVDSQIRDTMNAEPEPYRAFVGTLFLFILAANWSSLIPGLEPPTAALETDAALALLVFVAVVVFALRTGGLRGYLRTFARPTPLIIPLNFLETLTRTLSLFVRLFGNVMSGVFVVGIVLSLAALLVPIPFMALELLTGLVQAYIFTVLAMVFISGGVEEARPPATSMEKGDH